MTNPVYVSKQLNAASSTAIGTFSSGATSLASVNSSNLDTQRRIQIAASSGSEAGATFIITGTNQAGQIITESLTGPTSNVAVSTKQDFLSVTSVISSSAINSQVIVGTNTVGGTPWQSVNTNATPMNIGAAMTFSSTANSMSAQIDVTLDNPWAPSPAPPGGLTANINTLPTIFQSTHWTSITSNNWDGINVVVGSGAFVPIFAWRLTLTSSSSSAGSVNVTAVQAGIGS